MDILRHIPPLIAAVCLTIYWVAVVIKLIRLGRKLGKDPNALPREPVGQLMRIIWYPLVILMLIQSWLTATGADTRLAPRWGLQAWVTICFETNGMVWAVTALAAALCLAGTAYTFVCWRKMGRSWRIGIDPNETLELVSSGPYRYVRHPIYAIRMVVDLCAWVLIPTALMALTAAADILLMQIEARREERYMEATHGPAYTAYKKNVGRFVPRARLV